LLLYDRVNLISPKTTPIMGRVLADSPGEESSQISRSGEVSESGWLLSDSADSVVNMTQDERIVGDRWDEFLAALVEDLADEEVDPQLTSKTFG